jgi:Cu/Ag efflux pump CusA
VSILASLLVSLTVTPVLSYYLLPQSKATHREGDGPLLRAQVGATPLIRLSMAVPGLAAGGTWLMVAFAGWQLANLGRNFLPQFDEGSIQVNVTLPPGSSLDASNQVSRSSTTSFASGRSRPTNPDGEILHFVRRTGRAEMDEHAAPVNAANTS